VRHLAEHRSEERRSHVRVPVSIPVCWSPLATGPGDERVVHETLTRDLSANGFSFAHDAPVPTGTHISADFSPEFTEALSGVEGVVASSTLRGPTEDGKMVVGGRVIIAPGVRLMRLLLAAYEYAGEYKSVCASVRHCGDLRKACPAFAANRNCWQVDGAPCCEWKSDGERPDCADCPVTVLAFMTQ